MLLFKPEHVQMILDGKKTQTRRVWKTQRIKVGSIQLAKTRMLSKEFFAKLRIKRIWKESINNISDEDVWKEGYSNNRFGYLTLFYKINKHKDIAINPIVYCVEFEVVKPE